MPIRTETAKIDRTTRPECTNETGGQCAEAERVRPGRPAASVEATYGVFYQVERAGQVGLSDGGGPFGFDITVALLVDSLISAFRCDAICETGCYLGDTTVYLARRYPALPVLSCDIEPAHVRFTQRRVRGHENVAVRTCDSPQLVAEVAAGHDRPLFFLDAHWANAWPLPRELAALQAGTGVAVVHDFDVGHSRYAYDSYQGQACGPSVLTTLEHPPREYFTADPDATWPLPCLQTGRRAGVGVIVAGLDTAILRRDPRMRTHRVPSSATTS